MDRLTEKKSGWNGHYMKCADQDWCDGKCGSCPELDRIVHRLAYYEDLEERGRLVILPCKLGADIFRLGMNEVCGYWQAAYAEVYPDEVVMIDDSDNLFTAEDIGKTVFLSREEAEKVLRKGYISEDIQRQKYISEDIEKDGEE